jgi:chloramphenicol 3-O-phosphotransferase
MNLTEQLTDYIRAAFSGLYLVTHEPDEAEREIAALARSQDWKLACWDIASGLRFPNASRLAATDVGAGDPLAVLRAMPSLAERDGTALVLLHNYHKFWSNPEVVQTAFAQLVAGKQQRTFLVILAPIVNIPIELDKLFVVLDHVLPDRDQLEQIARGMTADRPEEMPTGDDLQRVLDAAAGLTRYEAENSFALSLIRHDALRPDSIWEMKSQALKKNNLLTLHRGGERFEDLGGLQNLKDFCRRALRLGRRVQPRGVLLLGVPGVGKSCFARALGNEVGRPTLLLDVGSLYGSLVGSTEQNVRQALRIIDAMAPCVAFVDEIEKALAGVGGSGDSGVATRLFGTLLTYLSDHESDVFVIATSNDISKLPPEFTRAERWDGLYFLDLPTAPEKDAIWTQYRRLYAIPEGQARPDDTSWTGAEIRSCCRLAALLDVPLTQAAHHVVPVAVTAAEQVERLRSWASGRCLSASAPGIYRRDGEPALKPGRRVQRGSSNN